MVYNALNRWVCELCLSIGILNYQKAQRFGNESVSVFRSEEGDSCTVEFLITRTNYLLGCHF